MYLLHTCSPLNCFLSRLVASPNTCLLYLKSWCDPWLFLLLLLFLFLLHLSNHWNLRILSLYSIKWSKWHVQPEPKWSPGFRHMSELVWCTQAPVGGRDPARSQFGEEICVNFQEYNLHISWLSQPMVIKQGHASLLQPELLWQETSSCLPQSVLMLFPEVPRGMSHLYSQIKLAPAGIRKCISQGHFAVCVRGHHKLAYARWENNWVLLLRKRLKIFI